MLREVQIPVLAALLLGGCSAKMARALRTGSMDDGLGPTALFPMHLRRPLALIVSVIECALGIGLIATAGTFGQGTPADCIRLGTGLLFTVAACALLELRAERPDVGCGCFGDFSTAPVSVRTVVRSALLAVAAFATIQLKWMSQAGTARAAEFLVILAVELIVLGALSPELGEALVRLGYSEPCELRAVPAEKTLAALRRSKQWRRHARMLLTDTPTDLWRELCWRYVVFPARYPERSCEVVFAVFLQHRRPAIHAAVVDAVTGERLPLPQPHGWSGRLPGRRLRPAPDAGGLVSAQPTPPQLDLPFSSDL